MLDDRTVAAYLDRISADAPRRPDIDALRHLHARHVMSVPFESLDYHYGREIYYKDERVVDKIVNKRRGGGCGELNTAFYFLLQSLGFNTTLHQGRVWIRGRLGPPYNHVILTTEIDGTTWLIDVGFGKGPRFPLHLERAEPQPDPHGMFAVRTVDHRSSDIVCNGKPLYRFYDDTVELTEFDQVVWWVRHCPDSPFLQSLFCSLPLENGWAVLKDDVLTVTLGEEKKVEKLADDDEVLEAYQKWFGMKLEKRPTPSPYVNNAIGFSFEEG